LAELNEILSRARAALDEASGACVAVVPAVEQARLALLSADPAQVERQAAVLSQSARHDAAMLRAASSLRAASPLLEEARLLRGGTRLNVKGDGRTSPASSSRRLRKPVLSGEP
jgi:hypothetical protein